ncbi:2-hydroxyacid dehydrogenase [Paracoccus litorisediminis]|uniref:2-hydroxyacid dehydrogenase n=1 Tax=Paracoccus litorisediminis TaxID=2006130 RepID=A0A844HRJ3_9RHOB|nr:2-hydroxyacid dehydrogenase [Paracoccus litorisediminis]MTH60202.1 2-hydroxyacid dehydrogenase [Paracoccus litorisediminis]
MKQNVLVCTPIRPEKLAILEDTYNVFPLYKLTDTVEREALIDKAGETCTAMVSNGHFPADDAFLTRLPHLQIAACSSVGYETLDVDAMTRRGIRFTNTPDVLTDDVADIAILLMLAVRRNLVVGDAYVRSGDWGRKGMLPLTRTTSGRKVGIVGLGRIGAAIAKRCAALGMEIGYYGRAPKPGVPYQYFGDVIEMAGWSDVLIAAASGGPETAHLVSAAALDALGPEGSFINISRGSVVDESALLDALESGRLGSAGLDVFLNEPNPDPRFGKLSNVVLYPHHASGTVETRDKMSQLVVDNLAAHYAGQPLLTPVN